MKRREEACEPGIRRERTRLLLGGHAVWGGGGVTTGKATILGTGDNIKKKGPGSGRPLA